MEAIEFKTIIKNDGTIELPEKYKNFSKGLIQVILLKDEKTSSKDKVAQHYDKVKATINEIQD